MRPSPSMPEVASALASVPQPSRASSRVLCLILRPSIESGMGPATRATKPRSPRAIAEAFLRFSPRVQFREPNLIFLDVASTAHLFRSAARDAASPETGVLESAVNLARELGFEAKAAISDTPAAAQAFAYACKTSSSTASSPFSSATNFICHPGEERELLQSLSLPLLLHLEGLIPWSNARSVEQIVTFFFMLGFETVRDLDRFTQTSFQDRWGETGAQLWKRLRGLDRQVISPFLPTEPLEEYVHLDFPISLASLLLHQVQRSMQFLFARLQGRCLFARRLVLRLHCEYSDQRYKIEIEPNTPCRDMGLFLTLFENKLESVDLENPIRDFELEVIPCPERTHQLDFFEPRTTDQDKLESLFSLLQQSSVRTGRYEVRSSIFPERSWGVHTGVHTSAHTNAHTGAQTEGAVALAVALAMPPAAQSPMYQHLPDYGIGVMNAPRPTRLLREPRRLNIEELQQLQILTGHPIERLEDAWWDGGEKRDYYYAVSPRGQCLWIYQNLETQDYYLHGYFD